MGQIEDLLQKIAGHRVYIDTNIFIYFLDRNPIYFQTVTPLMEACSRREFFGITGELVLAEVMVRPYKIGDATMIAQFRGFFRQKNFLTIAEHEASFFDESAMLAGQNGMKLIDAIHYRTALHAGCSYFLTNDTKFPSNTALEVINIESLMNDRLAGDSKKSL